MSRFWSDVVKGIEPYVPGEQPQDRKYIKLNTNENPYPPSPKAIQAIRDEAGDGLRLYPDPLCKSMVNAVSEYYGLDEKQVFVGNGSDEVLAFAFQAYFNEGDRILYPDITYSFYPVYSAMFQVDYDLIPLDQSFGVTISDYQQPNDGIIIANPNAPTGVALTLDQVRYILDNNKDQVVIIDEAYVDFGAESAVSLIDAYENLLVVQTLSKSRSLAGMRVGFALGNQTLIEALDRVKNSINSYTLDKLALAAGAAAMGDVDYFEKTRQQIISTREWVTKSLVDMGFDVPPSKANFVFAAPSKVDAAFLFKTLKDRGILVRYFNKPRINGYLRISIGTDDEMKALCSAIEEIQG